ncbi:hypothetical protein [Deinococcus multiflagellatus]|uniref:hypothetical protein n=1 Tax=Deinococcus multiflagellatus TaxID=1656887 RepID=UPI001CCB61C1|nr:hypothetical protein [Deinococcus multiflagellatus]MBZ9715001.1 hypothetical protein [Deinococcus multiflagellatus]
MTNHPPLTAAQATRLVQALLQLMVEHGLGSLQAGPAGGHLGLTAPGQFVTSDLTFHFLSPAEHRAAAQAYGVPGAQAHFTDGPKTSEAIEPFVRAVGGLFDLHGVQSLTFAPGGHLGFRASGTTREFVLEGVSVQARPAMNTL